MQLKKPLSQKVYLVHLEEIRKCYMYTAYRNEQFPSSMHAAIQGKPSAVSHDPVSDVTTLVQNSRLHKRARNRPKIYHKKLQHCLQIQPSTQQLSKVTVQSENLFNQANRNFSPHQSCKLGQSF